ncbi:MBL fold metallo-hydrolase [Paenibacillus montanisoli]|uniref:MBL fold metallo-hydrolase n=1 Tax=Paenibacillus montanisoli TaxID=2081970 RepID=A0A328U7M9_9BACL|nr:MBL fold metallo-hydrolase [Paenibacillus montanisoli]RAP76046.1 MBL fold metallo-hydrolase [Paenibacillus montanisoli]
MEQRGIKALKLAMKVNGNDFVVHAALLWDERELILVDTGITGQTEVIREAMAAEGFDFDKLTKIIITHQDRDHIGSLPELVALFEGRLEVIAHEAAVPYLGGELPLIKSQAFAPQVKVDTAVSDGVQLPYAGGIRVIYTPGHSPDHIALYHVPSKTLVTGDSLTANDGVLQPPAANFTPDWETAIRSVTKFQSLDIAAAIVYHGGVCTDQLQDRLADIAGSGA